MESSVSSSGQRFTRNRSSSSRIWLWPRLSLMVRLTLERPGYLLEYPVSVPDFSRVAEGTDNDIQRPLIPGFGFALFASKWVNALGSYAFGGCTVILPDVGSHGDENARLQASLHFLSLFINIRPQQHFYAAGKIFQRQNGEFSTGLADFGVTERTMPAIWCFCLSSCGSSVSMSPMRVYFPHQ